MSNLQLITDIEHLKEARNDTPGNAEIMRLLSKLDTFRNGTDKQSLLITSALLGEGKSTISTNIAIASSRNRQKPSLIIDFDLRRPRLHHIFKVGKEPGVVDVLCNDLPFQESVKESDFPNLKIITSGNLKDSPIKVFNSQNIKSFLDEAGSYYNYIIVDVPPVIPVSDPLIIGKFVDNVILVVKAGETPKRVVKRAIDMLHNVEIEISGIILNNVMNVLPYYYDHTYYGYDYYNYDRNGKTKEILDKNGS